MKNWRDDPMTMRQEEMIAIIKENAAMNNAFIPAFHGRTKGEASDYISQYRGLSYHSIYCEHEDAGDRA